MKPEEFMITSKCTPNYTLKVTYNENPNGLPVTWMQIINNKGTLVVSVPLDRESISKLLVATSNLIGWM